MTQTLGTNTNNDIFIGPDGKLVLLSALPAVEAACATASKAQLGEMVLTTKKGLPNFQAVWVGVPNIRLWESYLRNTLQNVEGVDQVKNLTASQQSGALNYTATISTPFGQAEING